MTREADHEPGEFSSSPCYLHEYLHEFEQGQHPTLSTEEVAGRLNELLEGERAGALGLIDMKSGREDELGALLAAVAKDEARFCSMLGRHLDRLGYTPSRQTGVFYQKLGQRETLQDKLRLLDRGQSAVVRVLDELLPSVQDRELRDDLVEMRDTHIHNIRKCAHYLDGS